MRLVVLVVASGQALHHIEYAEIDFVFCNSKR
jgi:hypothetical protein